MKISLRNFEYIHVYSCLDHLNKIDDDYTGVYVEIVLKDKKINVCQQFDILYSGKLSEHDLLNLYTTITSALAKTEEVIDGIIPRTGKMPVVVYCAI